MVGRINPNKAGLSLGAVMGVWHLSWALLVALGFAQTVIDFVLWMHFIKPIYAIAPFDAPTAAILVILTTLVGYIIGVVFSWLWNAMHKA